MLSWKRFSRPPAALALAAAVVALGAGPGSTAAQAPSDEPAGRDRASPQASQEAPHRAAAGSAIPSYEEYRIGANDLLVVEVFGVDELDRKARVMRDGTISLPLLGAVPVAGMSLEAGAAEIARRLREKQLVNDPHVTLFVEEYLSRGISIQGAVQRPGVYQMLGSETLLGAIGMAGGLSGRDGERAAGQIYVLRLDRGGKTTRLDIDTARLFEEGDATLNIPLQPGDSVVVPFAQRLRIYVSGAVENPGAVEFLSSDGITLLQAITSAGGPSERAKLGSVYVKRRLPDGGEEQLKLNLKRIRRGKDPDVPLEANDTVVVGDWFF